MKIVDSVREREMSAAFKSHAQATGDGSDDADDDADSYCDSCMCANWPNYIHGGFKAVPFMHNLNHKRNVQVKTDAEARSVLITLTD